MILMEEEEVLDKNRDDNTTIQTLDVDARLEFRMKKVLQAI